MFIITTLQYVPILLFRVTSSSVVVVVAVVVVVVVVAQVYISKKLVVLVVVVAEKHDLTYGMVLGWLQPRLNLASNVQQ